jgi:transcriptional regulator with XRE-family HTH domain
MSKISNTRLVLQFSKNARAMRLANNMTKGQLAAAVEVTVPTISRIERAGTHATAKQYNPTLRTITKFANAAGVTTEQAMTAELQYA